MIQKWTPATLGSTGRITAMTAGLDMVTAIIYSTPIHNLAITTAPQFKNLYAK